MAQLHDLTLLEQAAATRSREVSPVELVEHHLRRIEQLSATVGAFVTVTADRAIDAARAAERQLTDATDLADLPPLLGVPTGIKDLNLTAGVPTTFGTASRPPVDLGVDDAVVVKLRDAGLISLGKTNTPEFGLPRYTEPDVAPPARAPWDLERSAGGSSGGAAAAVAAGLLPAAQGSDGGGSIRIPASVCGLVGLKSSRHRVSSAPFGTDISGLAVNGPLARTVRDAAALLDAMAGPVAADWTWAPPPSYPSFLAACDDEPRGLRIGRYAAPVIAHADVHPDCLAAYEAASRALAEFGHEVVDHTPTWSDALAPAFEDVWAAQAAALPIDDATAERCRPLTRWLRERGLALNAQRFLAALTELRLAARVEVEATGQFDAVLTPTLAQPPVAVGGLRDDADPSADFEAQKRFTPFTSPYNMTGQPAISLPLHWNAAGLPIGVQLVGRPHDEATLLRLGAQLEAAAGWPARKPPLW